MKIKRALFILAAAAVTVICAVIIVAGVGELLGRPEASDIRAEDPDESTDISGVRENEKGEAAMEPEGQEQENASADGGQQRQRRRRDSSEHDN